jgi:two-component system, NarL family, nitrate/nitrite response regulator NarL
MGSSGAKSMKIVVCDDHLMFLEALTAAFTLRGHEVFAAATPESCVRRVAEHAPAVVTVDITMPGGDIFWLVREVRATAPDTPIVVVSGMDPCPLASELLAAGVAGFLRKDESTEAVLDGLVRAASGELVGRAYRPRPGFSRVATPAEVRLRYLTTREREVLSRIVAGDSTKDMARALGISYSTTRTHVQNVLQKLGVNSRLQAAALVGRSGSDPANDAQIAPDLLRLTYPSVLHG